MSTLMSPVRSGARRVPRFAEAALDRARLTVVPQRAMARADTGRTPFVVLMLAMLAAGVVGLLMFNTNMQQSSFEVTRLQDQVSTLSAREQSLAMELESLRDPQRLAITAKRLGMVPPAEPAFVSLSTGRVLGNPTPATPADAVRINSLPAPKPAELSPKPIVIKVQPETSGRDTGSTSAAAPARDGRKGTSAPSNDRGRTGANR